MPVMLRTRFLAAWTIILAGVLAPANAAEASASATGSRTGTALGIYPRPQQVTERSGGFPLTRVVTVVEGRNTDPRAVRELEGALRSSGVHRINRAPVGPGSPHAPVTIYVGGPSSNREAADALAELGVAGPARLPEEGYVLAAGRGDHGRALVVLAGKSPAGTFYAAQSFEQAIRPGPGAGRVPGMEVRDLPRMRHRGVIEGFYGEPWTHADRLSQIHFYGEQKLNTYIYAPKDDPYHRERWREPYPPEKLRQLGELADAARSEHVEFVFSISPGKSVCYSSDSDFQALVDKSRAVWELGARSFAILLDDISAELRCARDRERFGDAPSPVAAAQAYLLNRFQKEFLDPRPAAGRLITVPTEYAGSQDSTYRSRFGKLVNHRIVVSWTGPEVVSERITRRGAAAVHEVFDHDLLLWDNYPVNDYQQDRLFLGPLVGRSPHLADSGVIGLTANPMIQAEASKIPLFTVADFTWNPDSYRPDSSWRAAIADLAGPAEQALTVFAENTRSSPLSDVESPTLTRLIRQYWKALPGNTAQPAGQALASYFDAMASAPERLRAKLDNEAFIDEVAPWLRKLGLYGQAGGAAVRMLGAERAGDWTAAWKLRAQMETAAEAADAIGRRMAPGVVQPFLDRVRARSGLVTVTAPADDASLSAGADVEVSARLHSGDVSIDRVEFYSGPRKIGADSSAPYKAVWPNVPERAHTLYAVATATDGTMVRSPYVDVTAGDPKKVLFVTGDTELSKGDAETVERLRFLGYPTVVKGDKQVTGPDADKKDAVLVSSTVDSGDVGSAFTGAEVPVMTWEPFLYDDLGMSERAGELPDSTDLTVVDPSHPLAAGRSGAVRVYAQPDRLRWGAVAPEGSKIATVPGEPARATLFAYGAGDTMFEGQAPARRVGIFLGDTGTSALTPDGMVMFDAAVSWLTSKDS